MNKKCKRVLMYIIVIPLFFVIASCSEIENESINKNEPSLDCLEPIVESYIPVEEFAEKLPTPMGIPHKKAPQHPWKLVFSLKNDSYEGFDIAFVRDYDNRKEVWLKKAIHSELLVYQIQLDALSNPSRYVFASDSILLLNENNDVLSFDLSKKENTYWLSVQKFDNMQDSFSFNSIEINTNSDLILETVQGSNNIYWLYTSKKETNILANEKPNLYAFNMGNQSIKMHDYEGNRIVSLATDSEGNLFYVSTGDDKSYRLYKYNGVESSLQSYLNYGTTMYENNATTIFITENDILIWNDVYWFPVAGEIDDTRVLLRSPIFITTGVNANNTYLWERPIPQAVTPDGLFWYKSQRGLAWFQPETGEWCMFTTAKSNIVKDSEGNLWIIYDNSLYMLPASQQ